jgi:multisubunit Na+/H+ antiporter MnhB subunit
VTLVPVIFLLSHVLTTNEQFLITMLWVLIVGWVLILMVISMKEVNNYTPGETFKVICLTIFTILILSLLIFVIYVLWAQVFEFINAFFGEVVYRLGY